MLRAAMMALARFRPAAAAGNRRGIRRSPHRHSTGPGPAPAPDPELLAYLVCPLSRRRLRYEESTNQLINDELGIAYPIIDGIPNMIPQEAQRIQKSEEGSKEEESSQQ
ncbi:protein preY, mitochondrial-like [Leucoraja erinacea]|uniref:protein preY, mitochondrial-like n=1 Tax=Leucoraja erinaceus TaxID=7782 RepID=UPI002458F2C0|nr:protein preY, mitochondrial-like [Leucoraja erinacea]